MLPISMLDVVEYEDSEGYSPFAAWFAELDAAAAAKVTVAVARIEQGNLSNVKGGSANNVISKQPERTGQTTSGASDWRGESWF
jgi:hypothetical protein